MNKKKLHLRQNDLDSKTCYYFLAYLAVVHFQRHRKKYFIGCLGCRIMTLIDKTPFICRFFRHFIQFSISLLYKDVTRSDRIQRCDVTISLEAFGCFRNVFGKFKIYTFQTLINKLLLIKKFRKTFCMQKWPPNFIFFITKKNVCKFPISSEKYSKNRIENKTPNRKFFKNINVSEISARSLLFIKSVFEVFLKMC